MPKQDFDMLDYWGPVIVAIIFTVVLFVMSFCCINFWCITKRDDITQFEKMGAKHNIKLGPHSLRVVKRGGFIMEDELDIEDK